jgi:ABC-type lipoprotein export system ATPase subunit
LADEPTGNLDADSAQHVLRHLAEFAQSGGTVIMVTHEVQAATYARHSLELEAGRLAPPVARREAGT